MSTLEKDVSDQSVKEKTNELRAKYPVFTAILERIPDMDLKEVVSLLVLVDPVRSVLKTHATRLSFIGEDKELDQMVEEKINGLKQKDLKETAIGLLGIDSMESLLKLRMLVILAS
jgi:hypothetical protein